MNIKKVLLILVLILSLTGCVNINNLETDYIINGLMNTPKKANTYKRGYQFYVPKGLQVQETGSNYAILSSSDVNYYLYIDLVSYNKSKELAYEKNKNALYSKRISYDGKVGYAEVKLWENNQYLIEIMYNYAKIEVMVDESFVNKALINSISILNSVKYNDLIIEDLLDDENLTYTEEIFDMFEETIDDSNYLDYVETDTEIEDKDEIKDTDFIN